MKKGNPIARAAAAVGVAKTKQKGSLAPRKAGAAQGKTKTVPAMRPK